MRGLLRGFGLRVPLKTRGKWDRAIRGLVEGHLGLTGIFEPLLLARAALREQLAVLDKQVREAARTDPICKRLMTVPGVGAIVALTFRCAVDDPSRFTSSRSIGAFFGLTPRRYQSGETDRVGAISRAGDPAAQLALFEAAHVIMTRVAKWSALKSWAVRVAQRRGTKRGKVALARKLAVVLHRMWVSEFATRRRRHDRLSREGHLQYRCRPNRDGDEKHAAGCLDAHIRDAAFEIGTSRPRIA